MDSNVEYRDAKEDAFADGRRCGLQDAIAECERAASGMTEPSKAALLAFLIGRFAHMRTGK